MARADKKSAEKKTEAPQTSAWSKKTSARLELLRRGVKSPAVLKMEAEQKAQQHAYQAVLRRRRSAAVTKTIAAESTTGVDAPKPAAIPTKKLRHPNSKFMSKTAAAAAAAAAKAHEADAVTATKITTDDTTDEAASEEEEEMEEEEEEEDMEDEGQDESEDEI
jgi:dihydroorotate dehydrogenase